MVWGYYLGKQYIMVYVPSDVALPRATSLVARGSTTSYYYYVVTQ